MEIQEVIKQKLDLLAEYQVRLTVLEMEKQKLKDSILTQEIKEKLAEIDIEFLANNTAILDNIESLECEVKDMTKTFGQSVKGDRLHAVYAKGRISWDTKGLDGYAAGHPEILTMRKEGDPSVSLRKV